MLYQWGTVGSGSRILEDVKEVLDLLNFWGVDSTKWMVIQQSGYKYREGASL